MLKGRCYTKILKWHFKPIKLKSGMFLQMLIWLTMLSNFIISHSRITCCLLLSLWMHTKVRVCVCVCDYCRTPFLCFVFIVNAVCAVILCFFKVKKLNSMIVEKKSALAPIIKELRSLRQQSQVSIIWIIKRELQRNLTAHQTVFVKAVWCAKDHTETRTFSSHDKAASLFNTQPVRKRILARIWYGFFITEYNFQKEWVIHAPKYLRWVLILFLQTSRSSLLYCATMDKVH